MAFWRDCGTTTGKEAVAEFPAARVGDDDRLEDDGADPAGIGGGDSPGGAIDPLDRIPEQGCGEQAPESGDGNQGQRQDNLRDAAPRRAAGKPATGEGDRGAQVHRGPHPKRRWRRSML